MIYISNIVTIMIDVGPGEILYACYLKMCVVDSEKIIFILSKTMYLFMSQLLLKWHGFEKSVFMVLHLPYHCVYIISMHIIMKLSDMSTIYSKILLLFCVNIVPHVCFMY